VQLDTPFRQLDWECRRMRAFLGATLNCFVRNEPCIAAAAQITAPRVRPARNVTLVLVRNSNGEPIDLNAARLREVENVFMAIVQKALRAIGLKCPYEPIPPCRFSIVIDFTQ
jgi:hypothetical protein